MKKAGYPDEGWDNMGYPDMGNGRLSKFLTDAEWYEINNAQRAHYNTMESLPLALTLVMTSGLFIPEIAAACGGVWCIGRLLVWRGYTTKGPKGRYPGGPVSLVPLLGLVVFNVYTGTRLGLESAGWL